MAATAWSAEHPLVRWVLARPRDRELLQMLHLIDRLGVGPSLGGVGTARKEVLRLGAAVSLGFPSADIDDAEWREADEGGGGRLFIRTTFMGLHGTDSPLPAHFTETLLHEPDENQAVVRFLDLLHHRVLSLLYRVWKKYRYYVTFRRDGSDQISHVVCGLLGIETAGVDKNLLIAKLQLFRYVGLMLQRPRSSVGLVGLLRDALAGLPVDVEQCVGRWLPIEEDDRNRMGARACTLGASMLLGERIYDRSGKFRVKIGPLGFDDFARFLPGEAEFARVVELVRFYCSDPLEFDVALTLREAEVPEFQLGGASPILGRLSRMAWLKSRDDGDKTVVFRVPGEAASA